MTNKPQAKGYLLIMDFNTSGFVIDDTFLNLEDADEAYNNLLRIWEEFPIYIIDMSEKDDDILTFGGKIIKRSTVASCVNCSK